MSANKLADSEEDERWIKIHMERMKGRNIPFISAVYTYYNYGPLAEGRMPAARADIFFWPPKDQDQQQQQIMKTKLDAAKTEWKKTDGYKNLQKFLTDLSEYIEVSKIVGLGLGSLTDLNPSNAQLEEYHHARSYTQLAIVLIMQEELKNGPTLILQDPNYGANEIDFMTSSCSSRVVQVKDDPDGFKLIDNKTILFTIGCWPAFWYRVENGPPPVAIITDYLDTTVLGKPMLKPQMDLLKRYKYKEIAPKGTKGLGVNAATKFWTATH